MEMMADTIFLGFKIAVDSGCSHKIKKIDDPWKISYNKLRQHIKKQRHHFADKHSSSPNYGFFQQLCTDVRVGTQGRLSAEELMLSNCGAGEDA